MTEDEIRRQKEVVRMLKVINTSIKNLSKTIFLSLIVGLTLFFIR